MGNDEHIAPWDAPDPSKLKASATPSPTRDREPATPLPSPVRKRRSLLGRDGQTSGVHGIPEREFDPDLQSARPDDAPVPVAAHLARAGIDADVRVNTQTPPPVKHADDDAPAEEPVAGEAAAGDDTLAVPSSETIVPEAGLEDPVLEDWTVDPQPTDDQGDDEIVVVRRSAGPLVAGAAMLGTVALLAAVAVGVGWRVDAGTEAAPPEAHAAVADEPDERPAAAPAPAPVEAAGADEAEAESAEEPAADAVEATPAPAPAPRAAPSSRPRPAPAPAPAAAAPAPSPPPASVRPRTEEPPQATVRPVTEEDGRKVWAPWGDEATADEEAEPPPTPAAEAGDEGDDDGSIWGSTE